MEGTLNEGENEIKAVLDSLDTKNGTTGEAANVAGTRAAQLRAIAAAITALGTAGLATEATQLLNWALLTAISGKINAPDTEAAPVTHTWTASAISGWRAPDVDTITDLGAYSEGELEYNFTTNSAGDTTFDVGILESADGTTWSTVPYQLNNDSLPFAKNEIGVITINKGARYIKQRIYPQVANLDATKTVTCKITARKKN